MPGQRSYLIRETLFHVAERQQLQREVLGKDDQSGAVIGSGLDEANYLVTKLSKGLEWTNEVLQRGDAQSAHLELGLLRFTASSPAGG
jgi:hypothetical protein